jgi:hypothetical protein
MLSSVRERAWYLVEEHGYSVNCSRSVLIALEIPRPEQLCWGAALRCR